MTWEPKVIQGEKPDEEPGDGSLFGFPAPPVGLWRGEIRADSGVFTMEKFQRFVWRELGGLRGHVFDGGASPSDEGGDDET